MKKKLVAVVLGLAAMILNPFVACSALDEDYTFGATEMRAAVEGTWTVEVPASGEAPALAYTVTVAQARGAARRTSAGASLVAPATACGNRSLVAEAAACIDTTDMPLEVNIVTGPSAGPSHGTLMVAGLSFVSGNLGLTVDGKTISATLSREGIATGVNITIDGDTRPAVLTRTAPRS